jgi:hypothetical protein
MSSSFTILRALAVAGIAASLAGCGGASVAPGGPTPNAVTLSAQAHGAGGGSTISFDARRCVRRGFRVGIRPCNVVLTASQPTATVNARGPKGGTFSFDDGRCTGKNVASVSGDGTTFTVTGGTSSGHCPVRFLDKTPGGKRIGAALLRVVNRV